MAGRCAKMQGYRADVMDACKSLELPLTVRSTAIQIFDKIAGRMLRDGMETRDVVYAAVVLASKCEEIHGNINILLKRLPGANRENIFGYENEAFEILGYNFHFPSLYLRMYGVIAILQEKDLIAVEGGLIDPTAVPGGSMGGDPFVCIDSRCVVPCIDRLWTSSVAMLDRVLLLDKAEYREIELIYASLLLPCSVFRMLTFAFSEDNVLRLRSMCRESPLQSEMEDTMCV